MWRKNLTLILAAGMVMTGCQEELVEKENTDKPKANAIRFIPTGLGAFEDGEGPESRTYYQQGSLGDDGKWHCPISWVYGDKVRIYCEEASIPVTKSAGYKVVWNNGADGDIQSVGNVAYLENEGEGLCWGGATEHTFYGFYPVSAVTDDTNPTEIKGTVPNVQTMKRWRKVDGNWVGEPDMQYAYMRSVTTVAADKVGEPVSIEFVPLTTAVQVTLTAASSLKGGSAYLTSFQLQATTEGGNAQRLCGDFTLDLKSGEETLVYDDDYANYHIITVDARQENGDPMEITEGQQVTFTVFLLPGKDEDGERAIKNLKVRVPGFGAGAAWVSNVKTDIKVGSVNRIRLNGYVQGPGANDWMAAISDDVKLSQLSLPGSVNAFTRDITFGKYDYTVYQGNHEMDLTQWLRAAPGGTEESQFSTGVCVFEVATTVGSSKVDWGNNKKLMLVAGTNDYVSGEGWDFMSVIDQLAAELKRNPSEFAVVIPYYDPNPGSSDDMDGWAQILATYLAHIKANSIDVVAFDGSLTVGDVRGKLVLLTRFPGTYDDLSGAFTNAPGGLTLSSALDITSFICEWDLDKDRWYRRGYDTSNSGNNVYKNVWFQEDEERKQWQWMGKFSPGSHEYEFSNWSFDMVMSRFGGNPATPRTYVYDWERVCKEDGSYGHAWLSTNGGYHTTWEESMTEKKDGVTGFMDDVIRSLKDDASGDNVYINSLRGYYIVDKEWSGLSAIPWRGLGDDRPEYARHGDIPPYAGEINQAAYEHIVNKIYDERGPLGIMLMNYAGVHTGIIPNMDMYGDDLLQAIIDNNFRFLLKTGTSDAE